MAARRRRDPVRLGGALFDWRERRRLAARIGAHPFGARAGRAHDRRGSRSAGDEEEGESGEGDGSHAGCDAGSVLPVARLLFLQGALYFFPNEDREPEHLDFGDAAKFAGEAAEGADRLAVKPGDAEDRLVAAHGEDVVPATRLSRGMAVDVGRPLVPCFPE
jgi:hypothetical protein